MACISLGKAPRRSQQAISLTPNLTDENINTIVTPSVSNDLLDTENVSDQDNQASPPSAIQVIIPHCYMPPNCLLTQQTVRQHPICQLPSQSILSLRVQHPLF